MMMRMPVLAALDANSDGKISAAEIKNAAVALAKLDKNGDGDITLEEMAPDFGGGGGQRGGPGSGGPGGGGQRGGSGGGGGQRGGGPGGGDMASRLMQMDKDGDGKLSKEEVPERIFSRLDADKDGFVTKEEINAFGQRGGPQGQGGRRGGGQEGRQGGERPQRPSIE